MLAPILLLLLRLAQGVSTGGEFCGSITYLVEHAPPGRRGLYGSLANVGAVIGGALGAVVGWLATGAMSPEALHAWGWRVPFLCVLPVSLVGLWLRLRVPDTPAYLAMKGAGELDPAPLRTALRAHKAAMATVFGLNWVAMAGYYIVFVWLITEMTRVAGLSLHVAMGIGTLGLLAAAAVTLLAGALSDRFGGRTLLWVIGLATVLGAVPLLLLAGTGGVLTALLAQLALAALVGGYLGTMLAVFAAQVPPNVRCSGLAIGYNLAAALFGGTAPLIATLLVKETGWNAAPGVYLALTAVVGLALVHRIARAPD